MDFSQVPNMAEVITVADSSVIKHEIQEDLPSKIEELFDIPDFSLFPKGKVDSFDNFSNSSRLPKVEPEVYEPETSTYLDNEASSDNDMNKQEWGLPSMPGLARTCLKKEMNLNCQNEMPSHIYVFAENNVAKQEVFHTKEKPFECDICKKRFATGVILSCHQITHTGDRPFECDICERSFRRKAHLSFHQRTHTGEKPFECDICKKCFTLSHGLSSHKRIHTGEKPFKCDVCEKSFNTRSSFSRHQRTQHLM
ncbi:zinc finger protein 782-like isoform X2 [Artemia franciscana]|uniref:zinc finger protein 782-like isoform X2 n=1 Tax=Artemia franciscana TaxID=6661 RepID=UPI0032DB7D91